MTTTNATLAIETSVDDASRPWRVISDQATYNISMSQAYFWGEQWQAGESQASQEIESGAIRWLNGSEISDQFRSLTKPPRSRRKNQRKGT